MAALRSCFAGSNGFAVLFYLPSFYICTQHGSHMLDGVIRTLGGAVPTRHIRANSGGNTRTTVGAAHFWPRNAHPQWCNASIRRRGAHPSGVAHAPGGAVPTLRGVAHTPWRSAEHSHSVRHVWSLLSIVLKMNFTEVNSLYICGIAIIHFLHCCKHLLHVRHVQKTKSGPKWFRN